MHTIWDKNGVIQRFWNFSLQYFGNVGKYE